MNLNSGKLIIALLLIATSLYWGKSWLSDSPESVDLNSNEVVPVPVTATASGKAANRSSAENILITLSQNRPTQAAKDVRLGSLDDLMALFDSLDYNTQSWIEGNREVPRLTFERVSDSWHKTSNEIPVQQKKMVFFRLMAPLILVANENILLERQLVETAQLSDKKLLAIATKYKLLTDQNTRLDESQRQALLARVDIMPPSLVLAQAAEESGWATSRFTLEGNAFFGQWDFSGNGMVPKQQRKELGNYGLARFDSPLASVEGYMVNLNTHNAYQKLRQLRAELRQNKQAITGVLLAGTLDKYSERGQAYIDGIREMIRYNQLDQVDQAYLSSAAPLHLIGKNQ
ncbi:glucosaminidase [Shewanella canadensis]|uniref:Glucosaminidase n=1 Tax=Shewanella canadensis TaxID=271096 RepID=A0A431WZ55_9GAMM|nr:glucosaminidase domain-containing protein [Shewanella canadensis]RTR40768.1 glucosaminidase [Shewanella canadensis]